MSARIQSSLLAAFIAASLPLVAQADAGLPVYAIVAATLTAGIAGSIYGNNLGDVMASDVQKHQISIASGGDTDIAVTRLSYRLDFEKPLWQTQDFLLTNSLEASIGHWQSPDSYAYRSLNDVGLTPIFKLKSEAQSPWYAEIGVGVHYLSDVHIKDYTKSTQFHFGDQFGLGWENNQFRLGYQYLHVSNANIEIPNPSTDLQMLELGYRF